MNNNTKEIIERIKKRREELKLSYQDLADRTGLSKSTLQRYETGDIANIPLSKISALADGLQTTQQYIMGWDEEAELVNDDPELTEYLEELRTRPEMKMLFSLTSKATKADVEKAVKIVEAFLNNK